MWTFKEVPVVAPISFKFSGFLKFLQAWIHDSMISPVDT